MTQITRAVNEPILSFAAGSPERASLQAKYDEMATQTIEIPLIIDGKEIKTGDTGNCVMPHNHQHVLATYHKASETEVIQAIDAAMKSWKLPVRHRPPSYRQ